MDRIKVLRESKFNKMSETEMTKVKGGAVCLLCVKRARKAWKNGLELTFNSDR